MSEVNEVDAEKLIFAKKTLSGLQSILKDLTTETPKSDTKSAGASLARRSAVEEDISKLALVVTALSVHGATQVVSPTGSATKSDKKYIIAEVEKKVVTSFKPVVDKEFSMLDAKSKRLEIKGIREEDLKLYFKNKFDKDVNPIVFKGKLHIVMDKELFEGVKTLCKSAEKSR